MSAFECKLTLRAEHVDKAMANAVEIRRSLPPRNGTPYRELHSPILYGLLAHSHSWKGDRSTPVQNTDEALHRAHQNRVGHPRELLDLVCIADCATWAVLKQTYIGPRQVPDWEPLAPRYGPHGSAITAYPAAAMNAPGQVENFAPIGALVSLLIGKLAWEASELRRIAEYFIQTNISGSGGTDCPRLWDAGIYSEEMREKVVSMRPVNRGRWDEWSLVFF
ncbi:hypothetical protein ACFL09_05040 [Planctomycetota bacterium]